ncbi:MAG: glucosyltransferase domain-containing protein [Eubacteriales bacterium]|nr:glucosyltransferase domain-containing protein [Eubacteriales bacterium]
MENKHPGRSELALVRDFLLGEVDGEGRRMKLCVLAALVFGLAAHGLGLTNLLISHDSLHEFYWTASRDWKFTLGRFMEPILRFLMGELITLPWLAGLTGLLALGLTVHLLSKLFRLDRVWENLLLAGVCVTNTTVTALIATYVHDFAGDMTALLLSTAAAWAWSNMAGGFSWRWTLAGAVCLAMALGFYQAYLAVTLTVLCLFALHRLMNGDRAKAVSAHLLRALPMGLLAVAGYALGVLVTQAVFGVEASSGDPTNDLSQLGFNLSQLGANFVRGYVAALRDLFTNHWDSVKGVTGLASLAVAAVNVVLLILALGSLGADMVRHRRPWPEAAMTAALLLLFPVALRCVSMVSTSFHFLVRYADCLFYLLVLLCLRGRKALLRAGAAVLMVFVLMNNVQMSNTAYEHKELEDRATLSLMTRVMTRLDGTPDFDPETTEVAILGDVGAQLKPLKPGGVRGISGLFFLSPITAPDTMADYFEIVLQYPLNLADQSRCRSLMQTEAYRTMPVFPAEGCVETIDGVVVVKMSE